MEISGAIKASPDLILELWSWSVSILPLNLRERKAGASEMQSHWAESMIFSTIFKNNTSQIHLSCLENLQGNFGIIA